MKSPESCYWYSRTERICKLAAIAANTMYAREGDIIRGSLRHQAQAGGQGWARVGGSHAGPIRRVRRSGHPRVPSTQLTTRLHFSILLTAAVRTQPGTPDGNWQDLVYDSTRATMP